MSADNLLHRSLLNNPDDAPSNRLRGTSTGLALKYVSQAILNPNTAVVVKDYPDMPSTNKGLLRSVEWVIKRLQLVGFKVGRNSDGVCWCRFDLITPSTTTEGD
jgi:hypothetical protein